MASGLDPTGELGSGHLNIMPSPTGNPTVRPSIRRRYLLRSRLDSWGGALDDFTADYELAELGETYVGQGETIYVMYLSTIMEAASDLNLVLRCVDKDLQNYERIGIGMFWEAEGDGNPNAVITII